MDKLSLKYQGRYLALWTIEALSMLDTWYVSCLLYTSDAADD